MTTVASGRCTSDPMPALSAIGTNPNDATSAVIKTGRKRVSAPSKMLSSSPPPSSSSRLIKVTITRPFKTAIPESAINPTAAEIENEISRISSAALSCGSQAQAVDAAAVILAVGAQERPVPFLGWTLPGVLTVGTAQILLKSSGQIPANPVWIAGSGSLPLLYAVQLMRAGGEIAGYLDTTPAGQWRKAVRYLPRALRAASDLAKGLGWMAKLRTSSVPYVGGVTDIEVTGNGRVEELRYRGKGSSFRSAPAEMLLVHEGVVPNIHPALSLDCEMKWDGAQDCFSPVIDQWGESSQTDLFIAGDGAGIAGAKAAVLRGELAAVRVAAKLGQLSEAESVDEARGIRRKLDRELAARPFLDELYRPHAQVFAPADETIVCRCEEVTASDVRALGQVGRPGPNQLKAATRVGMGPCQGRQCAYTVARILAATQDRTPSDVGFLNIRPPLKPVTLAELASLEQESAGEFSEPCSYEYE